MAGTDGFHAGMSKDNVLTWFAERKHNRNPSSSDIYAVAKEFYHAGHYQEAARALEVYVTTHDSKLSGVHLLGYAYYMSGNLTKAIEMFKKCVNEGFDADWQLLVEIKQEEEAQREMRLEEQRYAQPQKDQQSESSASEEEQGQILHEANSDSDY